MLDVSVNPSTADPVKALYFAILV